MSPSSSPSVLLTYGVDSSPSFLFSKSAFLEGLLLRDPVHPLSAMPEGCDATEALTKGLVRGVYGDDLHRVVDLCLPQIPGTDYQVRRREEKRSQEQHAACCVVCCA